MAIGLGIEITEFDVDDRADPAASGARDAAVSDFARHVLDVVLDEPAVINLFTWDITNANTRLATNRSAAGRTGFPNGQCRSTSAIAARRSGTQ